MESLTAFDLNRRSVLQLAAGFGVSFLLPAIDSRAAQRRGVERAKSLIVLWLAGGPSQLETWDPHPGSKIGGSRDEGAVKAISTRNPQLQIADLYPRIADQADSFSVVRSLVSKEGDHERGTYYLKTGYRPDPTLQHPSVGAILAFEHRNDSRLEIPAHICLGASQWPPRGGYLGDEFDAFKIFDPGKNIRNLKSRVGETRQQRRLQNLGVITRSFRKSREIPTEKTLHEKTVDRALQMMTSDQLKAFDIGDESQSLLDAYGDSRFGRGCLVARRLVEQGVRTVEVNLPGWDSHVNNFETHRQNSRDLDPALATLISDLKQRDLLQSTVMLCIGEFGRTPRINPLGGRDHWPSGFSCIVAGGGLQSGHVIGETDPTGEKKEPLNPISVNDLYATILYALAVDYSKEFMTPIERPMAYCDGNPIEELLPVI